MGVPLFSLTPFRNWWIEEVVPNTDDPVRLSDAAPYIQNIDAVIIQAKRSNKNVIYVGNSSKQIWELEAGETVTLPIKDFTTIWIRRTPESTGDGINFIAGVY